MKPIVAKNVNYTGSKKADYGCFMKLIIAKNGTAKRLWFMKPIL